MEAIATWYILVLGLGLLVQVGTAAAGAVGEAASTFFPLGRLPGVPTFLLACAQCRLHLPFSSL